MERPWFGLDSFSAKSEQRCISLAKRNLYKNISHVSVSNAFAHQSRKKGLTYLSNGAPVMQKGTFHMSLLEV